MKEVSNAELLDAIVRIGKNPHHNNKIAQRQIIIKLLPLWFPNCFKRGDAKVPLAIGVDKALMNATGLSRKVISYTLARYCRNFNYLTSLVEGAPRYTLDGEVSGEVTAEQHQMALGHLKAFERRQQKADQEHDISSKEVAERVS